jgi:hypothetical protein
MAKASQLYKSPQDILKWAERLVPQQVRLRSLDDIRQSYRAMYGHPAVSAWEPPAPVASLAKEVAGDLLPGIVVNGGPCRILVIASPHADEPIGVATALTLAEAFLKPENRELLDRASLAIVPVANPDGYKANEPWFEVANTLEEKLDARAAASDKLLASLDSLPVDDLNELPEIVEYLATYLAHRRRSLPENDIEFGYAPLDSQPDDSTADFLPACRVHAAFMQHLLDQWGNIDALIPLHSMGMAGGAWALLRMKPQEHPARAEDAMDETARFPWQLAQMAYSMAAQKIGLGLHDEDRGGEKGFWRLAAGFHTTPTAEEMRQYFEERGTSITIRYNSMQYLGNRARRAAVPEVPLWFDPAMRSMDRSTVSEKKAWSDRAHISRSSASHLADEQAPETVGYRTYWERNAAAFAKKADQSDPTKAAPQNLVARARVDQLVRPTMAESLKREARLKKRDDQFPYAYEPARQILQNSQMVPVPLKHQLYLQLVLLLSTASTI